MLWTRVLLAFALPCCLAEASHTFTTRLKTSESMSPSSKVLALHRHDKTANRAPLHPVEGGKGYNIDIVFGGQKFEVAFDTGSSDLWVPSSNFKCVGPDEGVVPQSTCQLAQKFDGSFIDNQIANQHFNITYGSGEFLLGVLGFEDVSVAGITVPGQEAALVNYGFWPGDGQTSGLLGFAYPLITSAYKGTDPSKDEIGVTQTPYNPFFFSAVKAGLCEPVFSLALDEDGGSLTLGDLPPDAGNAFAWTPIQPTNFGAYAFYAILPDGFVLQDSAVPHSINLPLIVDSGTTLTYLPDDLALAVNTAFAPPAQFNSMSGVFETDCDATPPTFAIRIGGQNLYMASENLLLQGELGQDPDSGGCVTGIQPAGSSGGGALILGDTFLKNVVAVFDVGKGVMGFGAR